MKKERLTIEEIQALPKDAFPFTVTCDDGFYTKRMKTITFISADVDKEDYLIAINSDGIWEPVSDHLLCHYPSLKEPKTNRFYELVGHTNWYSDCGLWLFGIDGARPTSGKLDLSDDIKTGRFFDWDMDANKIVGKVGVE